MLSLSQERTSSTARFREFFRNDAMDAANFFNETKPALNQNQFGGAIDGQVIFPHYDGRNKSFFYVSYGRFRETSASNNLFRLQPQSS